MESTQKLQKVLATLGMGSRREIEQWIQAKRLTINHRLATIGDRVSIKDSIRLDNQLVALSRLQDTQQQDQILLYHKPEYEICSVKDPQGRPTVFDRLPHIKPLRWVMVGRLDYNTSGLLLFTTNGLLSHRLLHPSYEIEREYAVRVRGHMTQNMLTVLQKGVILDGKRACFSKITPKTKGLGTNHWYHVILKEGRQREVRRLFETQGVTVSRLMRIRFGAITLPHTLKPTEFIFLPSHQIQTLQQLVGISMYRHLCSNDSSTQD